LALTKLRGDSGDMMRNQRRSPSEPTIELARKKASTSDGSSAREKNTNVLGPWSFPPARTGMSVETTKTMGMMKMYISSWRRVYARRSLRMTAATGVEMPSLSSSPRFGT
jgi:hypothetical protein